MTSRIRFFKITMPYRVPFLQGIKELCIAEIWVAALPNKNTFKNACQKSYIRVFYLKLSELSVSYGPSVYNSYEAIIDYSVVGRTLNRNGIYVCAMRHTLTHMSMFMYKYPRKLVWGHGMAHKAVMHPVKLLHMVDAENGKLLGASFIRRYQVGSTK